MKKRFTFLLAALALLTMIAQPLRAVGQMRTEVVAYTLDGTITGGSSGYATESEITQDDITWMVTGNTTMNPWRIGGKSLTEVDRPMYSQTAIEDNITKIEVTHGTANNITVNSWTLIVASDASFNNVISTLTPTFEAESTTTIERPTGADWTNCYYKFTYNVSVSGNTNRYLQFSEAVFYKEEGSATTPSITISNNEPLDYNATNGSFSYTINNPVSGGQLGFTEDVDWIFDVMESATAGNMITFSTTTNDAAASRTGIITLTYYYGETSVSQNVTITQEGNPNIVDNISDITEVGANYHVKGMVVATSAKGFIICDGTGLVYTYLNALPTQQLGDFVRISGTTTSYGHVIQFTTYNTSTPAEIDEAEEFVFDWPDYTVITEVPDYTEGYHLSDYFQFEGTLTKSGSNYLVAVGESQIRISYPTDEQVADLDNLVNKTVRIHGFFTGYSGTTNLVFTAMMESYEEVSNPSITLSEYEFNYDAEEHDGYITVTYNLVDSETANVMLCDDEGEELTYEWIEAELDSDRDVHFFMGTNGSTARTAYLKVYGYGPEQQEVSSELVTINQAAYVAPEASITFDPDEVDLEAGEILSYEIPFTYENFEVGGYQDFHIQFYDDNNEPTTKPEWIFLASVTGMDTEGFNVTMAMIYANEGAARSAYLKVYAYDEMQNTIYSNLLTINQAACDFAVLPFVWEGGSSADFKALNGTTLSGNGSDYAASNAPYLIKLDSDGDYIMVKTDSQPAKVTMGVKMVGGATTSTIFVQGSSDGENFNLIDSLTISGAQNSVLTLETSSPFGEDDRYVKMVFKKGANVGVGPITITKFTTDPIIDAEDVELAHDATYGEIPYTITNPVVGAGLEVTTNVSWISDISVAEELVTFATTVNQGDEDRVASVTLSYPGAEDKTVTVTQAHFVVDYATLPFEYDGNGTGELPTGLTATDLGTYGSSPKMKFDDSGDNLVLKLDQAPVSLSYTLKGNGTSNLNGVFKVQTSANGVDYVDLAEYATYTLNNKTLTYTLVDLDTEVRYIKWVYTNKDNGNVGLGNIHASIVYDIYGDLSTAALDITPDRTCTVYSGATLDVTQMLNNYGTADNLIIMDGAQLKTPNEVRGTIQKIIVGVGQDNWDTNLGYYLLKSPVPGTFNVDRAIEAGMLNGTPESPDFDGIDLYEFSQQNPGEEWQNQKINESFATFGITANHGYLYANVNNDTLRFATYSDGESEHLFPATSTEAEVLAIRYSTTTSPFVGWELIGNPFTCNAYLSSERDFYRVNTTGDAIVLATEAVIKPCEGIFVVIEEDDPEEWLTTGENTMAKVHFATTQPQHGPSDHNSLVNINVISNNQVADVARVRFNNGGTLGKMILSESATRLSLAQEGKECSVVRSEAQGELPVNFKAAANGNYTINVDVKDTEMGYLHLIDNLTGNDVDLLATPSYSFEAKTTDYASRFRLVFSANNVDENTIEDAFAFISNGEIILNGVTGNTTIQVFDVTGRMINSTNGANRIATDNLTAGVYMLRLINGDNVKTQKIVVK